MTRFYESPPWRFVVAYAAPGDPNDGATITFLDRHATGRGVTLTLNKPAVSIGQVASDDPEINIIYPDGFPFLNNSNRLLYGFRREDDGGDVWVPRFSGIVMPVQDVASTDQPYSTYTAYDPWQLLYSRPLLRTDGSLPGQNGIRYTAVPGSTIALELLTSTVIANGTCRIDYPGNTGSWGGTITPTDAITIQFQQGISVGEAWDQLVDEGNMDIVLTPIYDPLVRPGFLVDLNIAPEWGSDKDSAIFAWDLPSRSLGGIDRTLDGSQLANIFQPYVGQGGVAAQQQSNGASISTYGEYWIQQFFPGQNIKLVVQAMALAQLDLRSRGMETLQISPAPERSPLPFTEYYLGDSVPVYASSRLREQVATKQRVYSIPLQISDDQLEHVDNLLVVPQTGGGG